MMSQLTTAYFGSILICLICIRFIKELYHIGPVARFLKFLAKKPTNIVEKGGRDFFFDFLAEKWKIDKIFEKKIHKIFGPLFLAIFCRQEKCITRNPRN